METDKTGLYVLAPGKEKTEEEMRRWLDNEIKRGELYFMAVQAHFAVKKARREICDLEAALRR